MRLIRDHRGFQRLLHDAYPPGPGETTLASQSSIIGRYDDAFQRPGSSALWIGEGHHLYREEAKEFALRILRWCETGSLLLEGERKPKREEV